MKIAGFDSFFTVSTFSEIVLTVDSAEFSPASSLDFERSLLFSSFSSMSVVCSFKGKLSASRFSSCNESGLPPSSSSLSDDSPDSISSSIVFAILAGAGSRAFLSNRSLLPFLRPQRTLEMTTFLAALSSTSEIVLFFVVLDWPRSVVELI